MPDSFAQGVGKALQTDRSKLTKGRPTFPAARIVVQSASISRSASGPPVRTWSRRVGSQRRFRSSGPGAAIGAFAVAEVVECVFGPDELADYLLAVIEGKAA